MLRSQFVKSRRQVTAKELAGSPLDAPDRGHSTSSSLTDLDLCILTVSSLNDSDDRGSEYTSPLLSCTK